MSSFSLSDSQMQSLRALCDTFIPSLPTSEEPADFWARCASDVGLAEAVVRVVGMQAPAHQAEFRQLLELLGSPLAAAHWYGPFRPFVQMSQE